MARLYTDNDRYGVAEALPLVEAVHSQLRAIVRRKLDEHGHDWSSFVFGAADSLVNGEEIEAIERKIAATGHRLQWSAMISVVERPDLYVATEGFDDDLSTFSFEHPEAVVAPPDSAAREQRGIGDNVVRRATNLVGTARYVRTSQQVIAFMKDGVPPGTIAVIDDSGGTLTAPILEGFAGVICAGGTVRSHLGILTREYGIPCLMNARISGIRDGDRVEIETTAEARTAGSYQRGEEMPARIWRIAR